ncbi:MAG: MMPL family transporter [Candidatus Binatia bacterium]
MSSHLDETVGRACARWVAGIERRPGRTLLACLAVTTLLGLYAALRLGVNADPRTLISQNLPFQVRQRQLTETFHTLADGILVVIDADSPVVAGRAADALAARLAERTDLFAQVDVPGGGPFFARNALLYLSPAQLEDLTNRLSRVQPFLAELARDQSLVGVSTLLRDALAAQRTGTAIGVDLPAALDRIANAIDATTTHRPAPDPWGSALLGGAMPAEARQRVVALRPKLDYGSLLNAAPHVAAIREAVRALDLGADRGIRVRITGDPVLNYEELLAIGRQMHVVAVVSFVLFSVTVFVALRSVRLVLALVASLIAGLLWTNAFAALAVGDLNQISAVFNVLIIGLGGELEIHVCMRYLELLSWGRTRREALVETAESMGPGLFSSACTTAIGFLIFLLTDFRGVAQLGLISGTGMFLSLASTFTVIPAVLALGRPPLPVTPRPPSRFATWCEHLPLRYAALVRVVAVAVTIGAAVLLPRVRFDYNLLDLRDPATESVDTFNDLLARSGTTPWTVDVIAPDLPAARALATRLAALPTVARTRTLDDWVPAAQDEKLEILETAAWFVPPAITAAPAPSEAAQREAITGLAAEAARAGTGDGAPAVAARRLHDALGRFLAALPTEASPGAALARLAANVVGSLPEQLGDLRPLLTPTHVQAADLPRDLTAQMQAPDGRARIEVFPREDLSDSAALERFVDAVRAIAPEATGSAVWMVEWGRVTWRAMEQALSIGMVCMVAFLILLWRNVWDTVLAFFPLVLAAILTCATMVLVGSPFNFTNVIVLPMLIGMGVDNGVHLVHRHRTNTDEVDVLGSSTARAVFVAAVTTILSFGSLGFASHRGLAAFGQLLTLGVFLTLVCYVVVLPAVLEWDDRRRRPRREPAEPAPDTLTGTG